MSLDALRLLQDNRIPYDADGPEVSAGWVNIKCPFCMDSGMHCGVSSSGAVSCWKCGRHDLPELLARILRLTPEAARNMAGRYRSAGAAPSSAVSRAPRAHAKVCELPAGCGPLQDCHRSYLESRLFDPVKLERLWGIQGTGPIGQYKFRVIAPVLLGGILVSYQGRDITGRQELRYKACEERDEVVHHKHVLYGSDHVQDRVIVVEGITDAWRLGPGAVATFGCRYTTPQREALAQFEEVFIMFDSSDPVAQECAGHLADALALLVGHVEIITNDWKDPGSAPQQEADALMRELGFGLVHTLGERLDFTG